MPEVFKTVYLKATGAAMQMHSVDAAEALRIGDYVSTPPAGMEPMPEGSRPMAVQTHPELQTPEEREDARRQANEAAALAEGRARLQQAAFMPAPSPTPAPTVPRAGSMGPHVAHAPAETTAEADAKAKADVAKK